MRISPLEAMGLIERLNYGKKKECQFQGETWKAYKTQEEAMAA